MTGPVVIFSRGLWRLKEEVAILSGLEPRRAVPWFPLPADAAIAGWGHKSTAAYGRSLAVRRQLPYLAFEDGFLRSLRPGPAERPLSMVMDRTGIYYDARSASDLELMLESSAGLGADQLAEAKTAIDLLRRQRLSKYNHAPLSTQGLKDLLQGAAGRRVLVADQTFEDASVAGGLADQSSFARMIEAAVSENPGALILLKVHPEVALGRKRGYLGKGALPETCRIVSAPINPWSLLEEVDRVYTVSSQLGFEALLAGRDVVCFGMPFYAGWGLTDDRIACNRRKRRLSLEELAHAVFFRYCRYFDAWRRRGADFFTAADQLSFLRDRYLANSRPVTGYRITLWKRRTVRAMLDGPPPGLRLTRSLDRAIAGAKADGGAVAAWGSVARRIAGEVRAQGVDLITIEDGFLRSVGLGASFTPALSYIFDRSGIYYDPSRPSELEMLLENTPFEPALLDRARALIKDIVGHGLTKYNLAESGVNTPRPRGREVVLVPGQVADDEAVRLGGADLFAAMPLALGGANLALLREVRARRPDAFIVYRPHPDVRAGLRAGHIPEALVADVANHIDTGPSIIASMQNADRVETLTSLSGFEALLRGKPVTVHGQPFYAGWGLTEDIRPVERRRRRLALEQLVAGALVLFPRYIDPVSQRPCPVEVAVERLIGMRSPPALASRLRGAGGRLLARSRYLLALAGWAKPRNYP